MASVIYLNESVWSSPLVGYKKAKQKGRGPTLENVAGHAIRSSITITKLPLGRDIQWKKKNMMNNKKEKCDFLEIFFSGFFLIFWLCYSIYNIITSSGTQQINFMEKFCVKQVFHVDPFCISPMGTGWSTQCYQLATNY